MHLRGWRHVRILVCLTKGAAAGTFCSLILKNGPLMVTFPSTGFCPRWSQIFLCRFINTSYSRCFQHHRLPREGFSVGFSIFAKLTGHKGVFFTERVPDFCLWALDIIWNVWSDIVVWKAWHLLIKAPKAGRGDGWYWADFGFMISVLAWIIVSYCYISVKNQP